MRGEEGVVFKTNKERVRDVSRGKITKSSSSNIRIDAKTRNPKMLRKKTVSHLVCDAKSVHSSIPRFHGG